MREPGFSSVSPTYTVSVLNTKEFYQGILTPIPMKSLSYYINIGFPKYPLLTLVVSQIEFGPRDARRRAHAAAPAAARGRQHVTDDAHRVACRRIEEAGRLVSR